MTEIKIIFFDIDGTLVDPKTGCISAKTREALSRLQENGMKLCIATGRPTASLPDLTGLHFDAFLTFNGSLCYTGDTIICSNPIPRQAVEQVMRNAASIGRPVSVAVRNRLVANGYDKDLADYYRLAGLTLQAADDFDAVCREDIYQIMIGCRESEHASIMQGTEGVKLAVSWERAVDVIPNSSGKGSSIGNILSYYQLNPSQAAAFGDSFNDMEMLQAVGTGIAMGNAAEPLKEIADDVCGAVSEDGIYQYCVARGWI